MQLILNDIDRARNRKYGFNDSVQILKVKTNLNYNVLLIKRFKMSYFTPSGKSRLAVKQYYDVRVQGIEDSYLYSNYSRYHFTSKQKALKYFKSIINYIGVLNHDEMSTL